MKLDCLCVYYLTAVMRSLPAVIIIFESIRAFFNNCILSANSFIWIFFPSLTTKLWGCIMILIRKKLRTEKLSRIQIRPSIQQNGVIGTLVSAPAAWCSCHWATVCYSTVYCTHLSQECYRNPSPHYPSFKTWSFYKPAYMKEQKVWNRGDTNSEASKWD